MCVDSAVHKCGKINAVEAWIDFIYITLCVYM